MSIVSVCSLSELHNSILRIIFETFLFLTKTILSNIKKHILKIDLNRKLNCSLNSCDLFIFEGKEDAED